MKVDCIIIDDEPVYRDLIATYIAANDSLTLKGAYSTQKEAIEHLNDENIELLFMDIRMPGEKTGLDFVRSLKDAPYVIFISSHDDFALESYEVGAVDYILKPLRKERFLAAVDKALNRIETIRKAETITKLIDILQTEKDYFVIRTEGEYVKIKYKDVLYIEAFENFVKIYIEGNQYIALVNLKNIEKSLPTTFFVRTHRSYLVNAEHIATIGTDTLQVGSKTLPLGDSYKEAVLERVVGNRLIKR